MYKAWLLSSRNEFIASIPVYLHSLLRGITFEVLPLSSNAVHPMILTLLEIFFGIPVVESLQWSHFFMPSVS